LLNELYKIHSFYKFSLDSFIIVVRRAIGIVAERMKRAKAGDGDEELAEGEEPAEKEEGGAEGEVEEEMTPKTLAGRVDALVESITY
jgi:dynein heavy chain